MINNLDLQKEYSSYNSEKSRETMIHFNKSPLKYMIRRRNIAMKPIMIHLDGRWQKETLMVKDLDFIE